MENTTSTKNTKEIDKAFEIDCSKYYHAHLKYKIVRYKLFCE